MPLSTKFKPGTLVAYQSDIGYHFGLVRNPVTLPPTLREIALASPHVRVYIDTEIVWWVSEERCIRIPVVGEKLIALKTSCGLEVGDTTTVMSVNSNIGRCDVEVGTPDHSHSYDILGMAKEMFSFTDEIGRGKIKRNLPEWM